MKRNIKRFKIDMTDALITYLLRPTKPGSTQFEKPVKPRKPSRPAARNYNPGYLDHYNSHMFTYNKAMKQYKAWSLATKKLEREAKKAAKQLVFQAAKARGKINKESQKVKKLEKALKRSRSHRSGSKHRSSRTKSLSRSRK